MIRGVAVDNDCISVRRVQEAGEYVVLVVFVFVASISSGCSSKPQKSEVADFLAPEAGIATVSYGPNSLSSPKWVLKPGNQTLVFEIDPEPDQLKTLAGKVALAKVVETSSGTSITEDSVTAVLDDSESSRLKATFQVGTKRTRKGGLYALEVSVGDRLLFRRRIEFQ